MKYYVYRHLRKDTLEVFYIGKGFKKRAYSKDSRNPHWKHIEKKHGRLVEILAKNLDEERAFELECFLIEEYGRRDLGTGPLVNLTQGGEGSSGYRHKSEDIEKMKNLAKGRVFSEETLKKLSLATKDENNPRARSVINCRGEIFPTIKEAANKYTTNHSSLGACCRGVYLSSGFYEDGTRINWEYYREGVKVKPYSHTVVVESTRKKVVNCRGEVFESSESAAKAYGIRSKKSINKACRGACKTSGKYRDGVRIKWRYIDD